VIFPEDFERKTGFDRIRQLLEDNCSSEHSRDLAREVEFRIEARDLQAHFALLGEFIDMARKHPSWPAPAAVPDLRALLEYLRIEGASPSEEQLHDIRRHLSLFEQLCRFFDKQKALYPLLHALIAAQVRVAEPLAIIQAVIDPDGRMRPNASAEFGRLGKQISDLEREVRRITLSVFQQARDAGLTAETELTVREERLVIPLLAEHKRKVDGLVHDVSARGRILYVEPTASFETNNLLKQKYLDRRREKERILRETANKLRPWLDGIASIGSLHARLDLLTAMERLATRLHAGIPEIGKNNSLQLIEARHPVLMLRAAQPLKQVVPLHVELGGENKLLIISGPNAGGKSIALKTILLLQYMVQCGLPVPADPRSVFPVFRHLLLDLGDDQSIDNDLSTYSAHLAAMKRFLEKSSPRALYAIDEMGTGTDPQIGGYMAEAILERLLASGAVGVVTTHYGNLKTFANRNEGVANAAMAYDVEQLRPMYKLVMGKPGSSFAIELARSSGLEEPILQRARNLSSGTGAEVEELLTQLEREKNQYESRLRLLEEKERIADQLTAEYRKLKEKIETRREAYLEAAKAEARKLLENANSEIELAIRLIREGKADKESSLKAREKIETQRIKTAPAKPVKKVETVTQPLLKATELLPGHLVRMRETGTRGELIEVKRDKAYVAFGLLKTWVPLAQLENDTAAAKAEKTKRLGGIDWVSKHQSFSPEMDVRGARGEEAMERISRWLDEAYTLGQPQLRVIHGKGDGILRKLLREHLKKLPFIKSYENEHADLGGDGATLIYLR
jgi:DNA mismatch repair protein MutS2